MIKTLMLGGAMLVAFASAILGARDSSDTFVITDVCVFDGERVLLHRDVVVEAGTIRSVEPHATRSRAGRSVNGAGATVLPGLIDAHTHSVAVSQLTDALRFGVTTILDMWTPANEPALRDAAATRRDVADFRSAGILATVPGGHGTEFGVPIPTVAGPDAADAFVADRVAHGSDYLKIVLNGVRTARAGTPNMDAPTAAALVRAAHARHLLVVAHIESLADVRTALGAGVDGFAHIWREGGDAPDVARHIAERHAFVVPTLATPDSFVPGHSAALAADPRVKPRLTPEMARRLTGETTPPIPAPIRQNIGPECAGVESLVRAGATLLAGTDVPNGAVVHGVSLHRELELLASCGLTPVQALAAATQHPADVFHLNDRGRIAPGLRADLLLVRGDPTADITATRDILHVWRSGVELSAAPAPASADDGAIRRVIAEQPAAWDAGDAPPTRAISHATVRSRTSTGRCSRATMPSISARSTDDGRARLLRVFRDTRLSGSLDEGARAAINASSVVSSFSKQPQSHGRSASLAPFVRGPSRVR